MPRIKRRVTEPFPAFKSAKDYLVLLAETRVERDLLHVRLRHVGGEQDGNEQRFSLAFPIRPVGPLASLAASLGAVLADTAGVDERFFAEAAGTFLRVSFLALPDGSLLIDRFKSLEEKSDVPNT